MNLDEIIKSKPYYMCRRCGGELFSSIGGMMIGSYKGEHDKANDEYLKTAIQQAVADCVPENATVDEIRTRLISKGLLPERENKQ